MKLKLADFIARLTRGYVAATGKQPDNLARLKIRLEAAEKLRQQDKVIDIRDRLPGLEGLLQTGLVKKGRNVQKTTPKPAVDPKLRTAEDIMEENKKAIKRFEEKMKKPKDLKPEDPENLAGGGRTGLSYLLAEDTNERVPFAAGGINRLRRLFLKMLGAGAAATAAVKSGIIGLGGRGTTKKVAQQVVKTADAPGKPKWFDALVTRIVNEGDDVTKGFATKERELVHTKQINDFAEVTVYRDLDTNTVRVNYGAKLRTDPTKPYEKGNISRAVNDSDQVDLIVKGSEDIEPTLIKTKEGFVQRRGGKTKGEFEAYESEPRVANYDGDIEFDGERMVNSVDDLMQDVSPLEEFATRKKLTGTKATKAKKKQEDYERFTEDQVEQANYLEEKYGPGDYASGGIARMLGE
jgi:hypothetical protein